MVIFVINLPTKFEIKLLMVNMKIKFPLCLKTTTRGRIGEVKVTQAIQNSASEGTKVSCSACFIPGEIAEGSRGVLSEGTRASNVQSVTNHFTQFYEVVNEVNNLIRSTCQRGNKKKIPEQN
jgi:hypothetical protein